MNKCWLVLILAGCLSSTALAQDGGQPVGGGATITNPDANTTQIQQHFDRAIINWNGFSVAAGSRVIFSQPAPSSVILNRVVGQNPTSILGSLEANGAVWVLNPNGILVGQGSTINVGSFVASSLSISDNDFISGNWRLSQDPAFAKSYVINRGEVRATDSVVLVAPLVENAGTLSASTGSISLVGASEAFLSLGSSGLVAIPVGTVSGGTILIRSEALSDPVRTAVNTAGLVEAGSVVDNGDGTFSLVGAGGLVVAGGAQTAASNVDLSGALSVSLGGLIKTSRDASLTALNGSVSLGGSVVSTGGGTIKVSAAGSILDDGNQATRLETNGQVRLEAGGSIGTGQAVRSPGWIDVALSSTGKIWAEAGGDVLIPQLLT